jgi:hypothetical protein
MPRKKEASDGDIGRPGPWGSDRYQRPGDKPDESVLTPPGTAPDPDEVVSTPVTRKDYESAEESAAGDPEPPGGDAG